MSYLVLARKWRPQRFEDIVGQGHITRVLRNAIQSGRIAHAYLFTGVRGVGKTTVARILAKALNCEKGPTPDPCGECGSCAEIRAGSSIDVYEIDGASNRGIDEVRQIIENVRYQPAKSRFKIYIIDEVHQVTREAFNALLKTLEEPPPFAKFILATTEPHRVPDTILSRCQRFDFRRIPVREIVRGLAEIAEKESLRITDGALLLLGREAEGSMRDAQSLLEQILSYAVSGAGGGESSKAEIDERLIEDILGVTERRVLYDLSMAAIQGDAKRCVDLIANVMTQGRDITRLSRELVEHFRNLLVVRLMQDQRQEPGDRSFFSQLLDLPDQEIEDLKRQAADLSPDALLDYFKFMAEGDEEVARSPYPRFALETTLIRMATLPGTIPVDQLLDRLEALEKRLSGGGIAKPIPGGRETKPIAKPSGQSAEARAAGHEKEGEKADAWRKFVAFVTQEKKFLAYHLEQARPLSLPPGQLTLEVEEGHHLNYLQDPDNLSALRDFAGRFFSAEVTVALAPLQARSRQGEVGKGNPIQASGAEERPGDVEQEVLRIFGGSIKQVKRAD